MNVRALPVRYGVGTMTAGLLRQRAKEFKGNTRDAFNLAADNVSVGLSIPVMCVQSSTAPCHSTKTATANKETP